MQQLPNARTLMVFMGLVAGRCFGGDDFGRLGIPQVKEEDVASRSETEQTVVETYRGLLFARHGCALIEANRVSSAQRKMGSVVLIEEHMAPHEILGSDQARLRHQRNLTEPNRPLIHVKDSVQRILTCARGRRNNGPVFEPKLEIVDDRPKVAERLRRSDHTVGAPPVR